jgi:hypothetical protein
MSPLSSFFLQASAKVVQPRLSVSRRLFRAVGSTFAVALVLGACGSDPAPGTTDTDPPEKACEIPAGSATPDSLLKVGCKNDFLALASQPLDASIPGARSGKVILDLLDNDALYFQNSQKFPIHYEFAKAHLSGSGDRFIGTINDFNPQYTAPSAPSPTTKSRRCGRSKSPPTTAPRRTWWPSSSTP